MLVLVQKHISASMRSMLMVAHRMQQCVEQRYRVRTLGPANVGCQASQFCYRGGHYATGCTFAAKVLWAVACIVWAKLSMQSVYGLYSAHLSLWSMDQLSAGTSFCVFVRAIVDDAAVTFVTSDSASMQIVEAAKVPAKRTNSVTAPSMDNSSRLCVLVILRHH